MICARCDQPIEPVQAFETFPVDSGSAARDDVTLHARLCDAPAHRTAPDPTRARQRREPPAAHAAGDRYAPPAR
ncbi:hypothetical protein [Streptomyces fructofermentans]|uniref:Uncharacterized protein n=1 Tax=Streptomyces fructofermentans TaxID=152141 RepID=A0A918NSN7_9ACTN|nr:hypothetical protein [Streptomyces fructofermentans]GGX91457.1 hypothetical protein GCM10010515_68200 [Streptomyces fructofermentans]